MHINNIITIYNFFWANGNTKLPSVLMRILSKQTRNTKTEICLSLQVNEHNSRDYVISKCTILAFAML